MLKNTIKTSAMAAAMLLSIGTAQADFVELAVNGDFETGNFSGWEVFPQNGANLIAAGYNSTYSGNSTVPSGPADNLIKQSNRAVG